MTPEQVMLLMLALMVVGVLMLRFTGRSRRDRDTNRIMFHRPRNKVLVIEIRDSKITREQCEALRQQLLKAEPEGSTVIVIALTTSEL
jgi:membrane-bound ClpP family serine protease